jgi:hypothetical protein
LPRANDDAIVVVLSGLIRESTRAAHASHHFRSNGGVMMANAVDERVTALEGAVAGLQELPKQLESFQGEVAARFERLEREVAARFERLERVVRDGDERNYSQMRMLHEDLVAMIAVLGERRNGPDQRPRRPKR